MSADLTSRGPFIRNDEVLSCIRSTIVTFLLALLGLAKLITSNARENDKTGCNIVQFLSITETLWFTVFNLPCILYDSSTIILYCFHSTQLNLTFTSYWNWPHILVGIRAILGYRKIVVSRNLMNFPVVNKPFYLGSKMYLKVV